jgi:hypothetical protein
MDAVVRQKQGDAEPRGCRELDRTAHPVRRDVEERTNGLPCHKVIEVALGIELHALADLFGEGHPGQEICDARCRLTPAVQV